MATLESRHQLKTFVMLDTETTGLPSPGNKPKIIELCFVALLKDELLNKNSKIRVTNKLLLCFNPRKKLSYASSKVTGLYNDALEAYGQFKSQANLISSFLKSLPQPVCLVAHNGAKFDFPLLISELMLAQEEVPVDIFCADSLEAFRELDNLPRVPEFLSKRKLNSFSPSLIKHAEETISNIFSTGRLIEEELATPSKHPRMSQGAWRIEEKTPEVNVRKEIDKTGQHVSRVLFPESPTPVLNSTHERQINNDHEYLDIQKDPEFPDVELFNKELISKEEQLSDQRNQSKCPKSSLCLTNEKLIDSEKIILNDPEDPLPMSDVVSEEVSSNGKGDSSDSSLPTDTDNVHASKNDSREQSYSLGAIYKRCYNQEPTTVHTAESDCLTLLSIIKLQASKFCDWCEKNAVLLSKIGPMH